MARKKTHEEFVIEVKNIHDNKIKVLGSYIGARKRIDVKCLICNHRWSPIAYSLLAGYGCTECAKIKNIMARTKTTEMFKKEVFELVGEEFEVNTLIIIQK